MTVGIVGLGLIGGSIAKAIRKYHPDYHILAYNRSRDILADALNANIIDGDEVYVVLTTKQNWQDGSEYKLLLNDATGVQYEIASLSGKQGGNYELVAIRGVVGTLKINNK